MEADPLKDMFDKAKDAHPEKMQFSEDETSRFKKAFDDPEFRKLFTEYVDELQNPENRAETEAYISQLEGEQKVPEGKELIRPSPAFVAKVHKLLKDENKEKVFINIVSSDKIMRPSKEVAKDGVNWSLPYSLGPPHMEKDSSGSNSAAFDCCFNPECLLLSQGSTGGHKSFRDLLVRTAMEGVEESYRRQKMDVKLGKEYHILKGVLYKQGSPPAMMIDLSSKKEWEAPGKPAAASAPPQPPTVEEIRKNFLLKKQSDNVASSPPPPPPAPIAQPPASSVSTVKYGSAAKPKTEPAIKRDCEGFLDSKKPTSPVGRSAGNGLVTELSPQQAAKSPGSSSSAQRTATDAAGLANGGVRYGFTERGVVTLGDFNNPNVKVAVASTRPKELVYRFEVPKCIKSADLELDVTERSVKLKYKEVYDLSLPLPYPVDDKKGVAKFDKASKSLTVTLPVLQHAPLIHAPAAASPEVAVASTTPDANMVVRKDAAPAPAAPPAVAPAAPAAVAAKAGASNARWTNKEAQEEKLAEARRTREEIEVKVAQAADLARLARQKLDDVKAMEEELKESDRSRADLSAKLDQSAKALSGDSSPKQKSVSWGDDIIKEDSVSEFSSSPVFAGYRAGYVFKNGANGVGYYRDCNGRSGSVEGRTSKAEGASSHSPGSAKAGTTAAATTIAATPATAATTMTTTTAETSEKELGISPDSCSSFKYEFRQTTKAVAIIVCVENIVSSSLQVQFKAYGVDVAFKVQSAAEPGGFIQYGMGFDVSSKVDVEKCTFNVASLNMVVVLAKAEDCTGFWLDGPVGGVEDKTVRVLRPRQYVAAEAKAISEPAAASAAGTSSTSIRARTAVAAVASKVEQYLSLSSSSNLVYGLD